MKYALAIAVVLALVGCSRRSSEVIPGADAEARQAAARQTLDDLAAASDAARGQAAASSTRTATRTRPVSLMPDRAESAEPRLAVAANVAEEDAPAETR